MDRNPPPSGTVCLLLTDIAGSTGLWEIAPESMAEAVRRHDAIVAEVVAAHGGAVIKPRGEGDSTFSVFSGAGQAAEAALALQDALAAEVWPTPAPIRVRAALHAGEPVTRDGDYYGPVVNRVARLRGSARPGQILVTAAMAELIASELTGGSVLQPVGRQPLRGLSRPEYVYRLARSAAASAPGGSEEAVTGLIPFPAALATFGATGYVGRRAELETLARLAGDPGRGRAAFVLVAGEPGIGKTRLAAEAARAAHDNGVSVLYGRCDRDLRIPYQPFVEALRDYVEAAPPEILDRYAARYGGDLVRIIPSVAQRAAWLSTPAASDPEVETYFLCEAVRHLLEAAAADAPVVLVLDDLHWADRHTVLLLRYVVQQALAPVLVLGLYRHTEVEAGHPLLEALGELQRSGVERIRLEGLDGDDLARFVATLAGDDHSDAVEPGEESLITWLRRQTAGNPFFTDAILHHLVDSGAVSRQGGHFTVLVDRLHPPESVMELIRQRVARLGEDVGRVLAAAAVVGTEFGIELLGAVLEEKEDVVLTALDVASAADLVDPLPGRPGRFTFTHALVSESLYEGLGPTRQARLHRTVAEEIEAGLGADPGEKAAELATHWLAARVPAELSRTIGYARLAGDQAMARLGPHDALAWYERALALGDEAATDEDSRADLLIRLGVAQRQAGDGRFRASLLEAAAIARRTGNTEVLVEAALANNRGDRAVSGRVDRERLAVLEAALAAVGEADTSARARLLATLALESNFGAGWERQKESSDEALGTARRLGEPATLAAVLALRHEAIRLPHTLPERLENTLEHLELAERLGDPAQIGFAALWRSRASWEAGDLAEVDRCMATVADLAGAHPYLRWNTATHLASRHHVDGRLAEAEAAALSAFATGEALDQPDARPFLAAQLVNVRWDQGRLPELEPAVEKAAVENSGIPAFRAVLALVRCEADQPEAARQLFEADARSGFDAYPYDPLWLCSMVLLAEVCAQLDDAPRAGVLYERLESWRGQIAFSGVSVFGSVAHYLGQLATVAGRFDAAEQHFAEAVSVHGRLGAPVFLARTRLAWAWMSLRRAGPGDRERARSLAVDSFGVSRRLGAGRLADEAARLVAILDG